MPAAARFGDLCSGHDGYPPRPNNQASTDVFIDGLGAHRKGDSWEPHTHDGHTHTGVTSNGSSTVFINGVSAARVGDSVSCGSTIAQGSPDVFIG